MLLGCALQEVVMGPDAEAAEELSMAGEWRAFWREIHKAKRKSPWRERAERPMSGAPYGVGSGATPGA